MDHSTAIDELPDNKHKIISDLNKLKDSMSDSSSDISEIDTKEDFDIMKYTKNFLPSANVKNTLISTLIVFVLFMLFSNKLVNEYFFSLPYIQHYIDTFIGNGIVGFVVALIYFMIRYFMEL